MTFEIQFLIATIIYLFFIIIAVLNSEKCFWLRMQDFKFRIKSKELSDKALAAISILSIIVTGIILFGISSIPYLLIL